MMWGFPKIRGTILGLGGLGFRGLGFRGFPKLGVPLLGVPRIRIIVFLGLYWGHVVILGSYWDNGKDNGKYCT